MFAFQLSIDDFLTYRSDLLSRMTMRNLRIITLVHFSLLGTVTFIAADQSYEPFVEELQLVTNETAQKKRPTLSPAQDMEMKENGSNKPRLEMQSRMQG
ncbi:hypothetical protein WR25_23106 [Diploscapter pachys]|uniref:Uncharacterized protein n=1 Tax=Diploscapter pachys TaxID=2018661 RepID=A0A2A2LR91_9BILA|nr:hypothetical protein WR25_23106 [Diploscapter pachys]